MHIEVCFNENVTILIPFSLPHIDIIIIVVLFVVRVEVNNMKQNTVTETGSSWILSMPCHLALMNEICRNCPLLDAFERLLVPYVINECEENVEKIMEIPLKNVK
jgi:hypothetical protein